MQQLQAHLSDVYLSGKSSERSKQRKAGKLASRTTGCKAGIGELVFNFFFILFLRLLTIWWFPLASWKESHLLVLGSLPKKWVICGDVCLHRGEASWVRLGWDTGSSQLPGWSCHSLFHPTQAPWNCVPAVPYLKILAGLTLWIHIFMWGDVFFPASSEHHQLMEHSGKNEQAALGQGGGGSPDCFFQGVLTASFSKLLVFIWLFVA